MLWEFDSRSRLVRVVWKIGQGSKMTCNVNNVLVFVDVVGRSCIGVYTPVALYHVDEMSVDCCVHL